MNPLKQVTLFLSAAALAAACGSTGTDPALLDGGPASARVSMKVFSGSAAASTTTALNRASQGSDDSISAAGSSVTLTSAHALVSRIDIEVPDGLQCSDVSFVESASVSCEVETEEEDGGTVEETEIKITGSYDFDLFTGISTPPLDSLTLPSGVYNKVRLRGSSITAEGTFLDKDSVSHNLHVALDINEDVEIENIEGMEVIENAVSDIILKLDVDQWFAGIDLATCVESGGLIIDSGTDTLTIDASASVSGECQNVLEQLKENVKQSYEVEDDHSSADDGANHDIGDDHSSI